MRFALTIPTAQEEDQFSNSQSTPPRVFVVLNPVAGFTDAAAARETINRFSEEHGWQCDIYETQKDEDLRKLVRTRLKKGVDVVIAAGGDGTISAVVSGMVNTGVPMGILPAGTGNILARDLLIPLTLEGALNVMAGPFTIQDVDVMEVSCGGKSDFYVMNVSVGITAMTMHKTARDDKRRYGFLAYLYHAIDPILHSDLHLCRVKADRNNIRTFATEVMVANCKLMGLQPQYEGVTIEPSDGCLDTFIIRAKSIREYLAVLSHFFLRRKLDEHPMLHYVGVHDWIEIQSRPSMPVQADGEAIGRTPVKIRLIPGALRIIVPSKENK